MKSILYGLFLISFGVILALLANGFFMIVIGAIGHIFNILAFQYLSYWEVFILSIIFGAFIGGGSSASK